MVGGRCFVFSMVCGRFLFLRIVGGQWLTVGVRWLLYNAVQCQHIAVNHPFSHCYMYWSEVVKDLSVSEYFNLV